MSQSSTLRRYSMGAGSVFATGVVASSPLTVLVGGLLIIYKTTGVSGAPLSFLVVMFVIATLMVTCIAVSRHVKHGAPFYAQLAHGWNPTAGLTAGAVAFVGYNALQISLYPLFGVSVAGLLGVEPGTWWIWASASWLIVFGLGRYPGATAAKVQSFFLALEILVILLFIAGGFSHPASGEISMAVFKPSSLLVAGAAASVLVFTVASFAGFESVLAYAEEATSHRALARGGLTGIGVGGALYVLASWAYGSWLGLDRLKQAAAEAANEPLALLGSVFGPGITILATGLLGTSLLAAKSSFHAGVARNVYAMAREHVLPESWGMEKGGAPLGGGNVQAITALVVLAPFVVVGAHPLNVVFPWLSTIGAFCILLLLTAANWSAFFFFEKGLGGTEGVWIRRVFPFAGGTFGVVAAIFMASSLGDLLGTPPGSRLPWLVAIPIGVFVLGAIGFGWWLRAYRPDIYAGIGHGVPDPAEVLDDDLSNIEV